MMLMGHGDDLVICDINHPAQTIARHATYAKLIDLSGCGLAALPQRSLGSFRSTLLSKNAFAIVRTSDPGPYGCFVLKMGPCEPDAHGQVSAKENPLQEAVRLWRNRTQFPPIPHASSRT
ncbi:L-fucose mutarotase/ribose pyranase (RbsD/FucU family) [Rhizobium mongolense]